jgi:small subunit ribosomal protein S6
MNVECGHEAIEEIRSAFRFNDAVLRHLIIARDKAVTEASPMAVQVEEEKTRERESQRRRDARAATDAATADDESSSEVARSSRSDRHGVDAESPNDVDDDDDSDDDLDDNSRDEAKRA